MKSPKSFLGASELKPPQQVALFEDLVCAMMLHIKLQAQTRCRKLSTGRLSGDRLTFRASAAMKPTPRRRVFWSERQSARASVTWYFSLNRSPPVWISSNLTEKTRSGRRYRRRTTDRSLLLMGPQWREPSDRQQSLLGHSGCRVGGNDLDIAPAF